MGGGRGGGLFNGTKGSNTPIIKNGDVRYNKNKVEGYLLNPQHPIGAAKAKFMSDVLGYKKSDSKLFHKNVVEAIKGIAPTKTTTTSFGIKHTYNTQLISKYGEKVKANVVVVIQKDTGRITYKIVTVYPD